MITDGQNHFDEMDNEVLFTCVSQAKLDKSISFMTVPSNRFSSICFGDNFLLSSWLFLL